MYPNFFQRLAMVLVRVSHVPHTHDWTCWIDRDIDPWGKIWYRYCVKCGVIENREPFDDPYKIDKEARNAE